MQHRPRRAAVCALALLVSACATTPSGGTSTGTPLVSASASAAGTEASQPTPPTAALADRTLADIDVVGADFPMAAFGSVWVVAADRPEPAVVRVDPATNEVEAEILVPGRRCNGLTAGFGSVWACSADGIARIDPRTNQIVSLLHLPAVSQNRLATTDDSIWAFTSTTGVEPPDGLLRINPRTEKAVTIPLGHAAGTMTAAFGLLWVTSPSDGLLMRVDPQDGSVATVMDGLAKPFLVSSGLDRLWISLHGDPDVAPEPGAITLIGADPQTFEVVDEFAAGPLQTFGDVVADSTGVWVRHPATFVTRFDPATHQVLEVIEATKGGGALLIAFGSLWATSYDFGHVWRLPLPAPS